jgi:4-aminobutyrate aminotransferase/(S)-3-amino-2-methylpropionate transaminase
MVNRSQLMGLLGPSVSNLRFMVDLKRSAGSYVYSTTHGTHLLDMFGNISSLPLGYNHPRLLKVIERNGHLIAQRQANGMFPSVDHKDVLSKTLMRILPKGYTPETTFVHTDQCGTMAVENLLKCLYARVLREKLPSDSPIISFQGGFHGRTLGALSLTHSNLQHKQGFPSIDTVVAPLPLHERDLETCMLHIEQLLENPVAGVIVEPIQGEGGDRHPSPLFLRGVQILCREKKVPFVVDEVQTGLWATGRMWAHEHHDLLHPPDAVVFSKRTMISGFLARPWLVPDFDYQCFNTWMGDTIYGVLLEGVLDEIEEGNVLGTMEECVETLQAGMQHERIRDVRGFSTFMAFDVDERDELVSKLEDFGVVVGSCGESSIRLRPPLNLSVADCRFFISALRHVLDQ